MSWSRYTDAGPLQFNLNKIMLYSRKEGWLVKLPEDFQNVNAFLEIQAEFNLKEFKGGFLYEVNDTDRIECAKGLASKLALLPSTIAAAQLIEDTALV
jgi:hypothetical protein